jgi:hypothetical protein
LLRDVTARVLTQSLHSNGCFSGSKVLAFSKYATIWFHKIRRVGLAPQLNAKYYYNDQITMDEISGHLARTKRRQIHKNFDKKT